MYFPEAILQPVLRAPPTPAFSCLIYLILLSTYENIIDSEPSVDPSFTIINSKSENLVQEHCQLLLEDIYYHYKLALQQKSVEVY